MQAGKGQYFDMKERTQHSDWRIHILMRVSFRLARDAQTSHRPPGKLSVSL